MKASRLGQNISRRSFLRGAGVALTLPWLESLPLVANESVGHTASKVPEGPPVRFGCIYFSNGVEPVHWWAKEGPGGKEIGQGLKPIAPYLDDLNFIRGLYNEQAVLHKSAHLGRVPNLLSGAWVSTEQSDLRVGKTMDQVLSQEIGSQTQIPSLILGIEPTELRLEDGLSMLYGSCISWTSDTKPAMKEIYPARVFDQLVGDGRDRRWDRSILDEVLTDAKGLKRLSGLHSRCRKAD